VQLDRLLELLLPALFEHLLLALLLEHLLLALLFRVRHHLL
jgi:hypothetical protein